MKINKKIVQPATFTHEGARAVNVSAEQQLRRSVMSCLLWEREFYEDGEQIADRITNLVNKVSPEKVALIASEARTEMKLRHVPLLIVRAMARLAAHKPFVAGTLAAVIQRPDELTEFLAIYWKEKKQPLSAQVKKGLAEAFTQFNAYQLAKYNRDDAIKLRDVLFLSHAKPTSEAQAKAWKQLVEGTLVAPDTWEVALSAGADKKETFERLMDEEKLGGLALLRNLRNMQQAGVNVQKIRLALAKMDVSRILPFRFIAAARYAPALEPHLEEAMFRSFQDRPKLAGNTVVLVDVSGSMNEPLSSKSDMRRVDAACGLAMVLRELCESVSVMTFSDGVVEVAPRRGFALRDAIDSSQAHSMTYLGRAIQSIDLSEADRLVVVTDEQSHDVVPNPHVERAYMLNVASAQNGIGHGPWTRISGFSEAVVDYIQMSEEFNY